MSPAAPARTRCSTLGMAAGQEAGYPLTADMNGYQQEGVGRMDMTIRQGRRWSAARAYLLPAMGRPNLHVVTRALTTRVLLERGRAVGVEYVEGGTRSRSGPRAR